MEFLWFNKAAVAEDLLGDPPSFRNRTPLLKMLLWWSEFRNPIPDRILTAKDSSRGKLEVNSGKLKCCGLEFAPLAWWHRAALLGTPQGNTAAPNHERQTAHRHLRSAVGLCWDHLWDSEMPTRARSDSSHPLHTGTGDWEPPLQWAAQQKPSINVSKHCK